MKTKNLGLLGVSLFGASLVFVFGCAGPKVAVVGYHNACPSQLPDVTPPMKTPGFWLSKIQEPDKVILPADQIAAMNERSVKEGLLVDLASLGAVYDGNVLKKELLRVMKTFHERPYYLSNKDGIGDDFWNNLQEKMRTKDIPEKVDIRYGFLTRYADERLLPSDTLVNIFPGDIEFDQLQNSSLDIGTAVAVLWETGDGWCYAQTADSAGWIPEDAIAFCSREAALVNLENKDVVVVTAAKSDIYSDSAMTRSVGFSRMGMRYQYAGQEGASMVVFIPTRDERGVMRISRGYLPVQNVNRGYLAYTARTVLTQAFSMLNAQYSWGGSRGEQDCSSFMQEIFSTCGINLPRNSEAQAKVGRNVKTIGEAVPAETLLAMPGHIMLFVGNIGNEPYAIHAVWAYREPSPSGDVVRLINKVAVTSLRLGQGTSKGSWMERIDRVQVLDK